MARSSGETLAFLGEAALIPRIRLWLGESCPPAPAGIGDDCAIVPSRGGNLLATVDPVIRGRHFDASLPPQLVAVKLARRNLSDIAAMGGKPTHALVALAVPADESLAWLQSFFQALGREALRHGVKVVGGDCAQTDGFFGAWLTLFGRAPKRPLTREGARAGDRLFVSGRLGGSILGRHARFTPRLDEGAWLAARGDVHAAIDLSDGLGKDIRALLPRGTCAVLDPRRIPIAAAARKLSRGDGRLPLDHALNDGEDYELLFAVAEPSADDLAAGWKRRFRTPLSAIGRLARGTGVSTVRFDPALPAPIGLHGYEHFR